MANEPLDIKLVKVEKGENVICQYCQNVFYPNNCPEDGVLIKIPNNSIYLRLSDLKKILEGYEKEVIPQSWGEDDTLDFSGEPI